MHHGTMCHDECNIFAAAALRWEMRRNASRRDFDAATVGELPAGISMVDPGRR